MNISTLKSSYLKFPPLNPQKLPDTLIYHTKYRYLLKSAEKFYIFPTKKEKDCNELGTMICYKSYYFHNWKKIPALYVSWLSSEPSGKGFGSKLLDFAQHYSQEIGCGGRIYLHASSDVSPYRIPHPFYRKYGLNTGKRYLDKMLDKDLQHPIRTLTADDYNTELMYYPPISYEKVSLYQKFKNLISNFKK